MIGKTLKQTLCSASFALMLCSVLPQTAAAAPLYFYPASAWSLDQTPASCKVSNQFNNGFIVTFDKPKSSHTEGVPNLSINFRQPAFTAGQSYDVLIGLPGEEPQRLQAQSMQPDALTVSLASYPGLLDLLFGAPTFNFMIEDNDFNFSLVGLSNQNDPLKDCAAVKPAPIAQPAKPAPITSAGTKSYAPPKDLYAQIQAQLGPSVQSAIMNPPQTTGVSNIPKAQAPETTRAIAPTAPTGTVVPPIAKGANTLVIPSPAPIKSAPKAVAKAPTPMPAPMPETTAPTDEDTSPMPMVPKPLIKTPEMRAEVSLYDEDDFDPIQTMPILNSSDWDLEKATLRYQEAERQLTSMGQKLQKERAQCKMEKKELEALLFDPQLTSEQQLAKLSSLEDELKRTKIEMKNQELKYKERIKILEDQLNAF